MHKHNRFRRYTVDNRQILVCVDISSQEPMLNTLYTAEPRWLEVFRNRDLRELKLTKYVDIVFSTYLNVNPNSINASDYWEWLDAKFHWNYNELVNFNSLVDKFRAGNNSLEEQIIEKSKEMIKDFQSFVQNNKKGDLK